MAELQAKVALSRDELNEFQVLKRQNQQYLDGLARQKAQARAIDGKNGIANGKRRS
jgi:hypothetical protein